jgi:uncharacterized protein
MSGRPPWGWRRRRPTLQNEGRRWRQLVGTSPGQEIIPREAVSDALVNALVEDGTLPGLVAAIEEYGKLSEQEPSEDEHAVAAAAQSS